MSSPDSATVKGRDFSGPFSTVTKYYQSQTTEKLQYKRLRPRYFYTDPKIQQQGQSSKTIHGDVLLQRIRHALNSMPVERHEDQKRFHEEFLRAVAPGLYGHMFESEYPRILKQNGWKGVRPQAMIITPRRWGKTYCVAMFVAAYLMSVPNAVQCIFSTSARISQMILELIYRFYISFPGAQAKIKKYTSETLWIEGDHPGDIRKLYSYPSNEKIWVCCLQYKWALFYVTYSDPVVWGHSRIANHFNSSFRFLGMRTTFLGSRTSLGQEIRPFRWKRLWNG